MTECESRHLVAAVVLKKAEESLFSSLEMPAEDENDWLIYF